MENNVLKLYSDKDGPNLHFLRAINFLLKKYHYPFGDYDHTRFDPFKKIIEEEFSAVFSDEDYTLKFTSERQKELFLLRFS